MGDSHYQMKIKELQTSRLKILVGIIAIILGASLGFALVYFPPKAWILIGGGGVLILFPTQPARFLLGYLVAMPLVDQLIPFFSSRAGDVQFGPQVLLRGGLTVVFVYYWLVTQRNPLNFKSAVPMLILLFLFVINTLGNRMFVRHGLVLLTKIAFWILLLLTIADLVVQKKMALKKIYQCVMVSVLLYIVSLRISEFLGVGIGTYAGSDEAVTGIFDPHTVVLCLSMGFIVVQSLVPQQQNNWSMWLLLLFNALIVLSIVRTYVRTGYIIFICTLFIMNFMFWRYGKDERARRQKFISVVIFVAILGVATVYGLTHIEQLKERWIDELSKSEGAGSGRSVIYPAALKYYANYSIFRQIFGGGLGMADMYMGYLHAVHNDYLQTLLGAGLVGIGLFIWLFISLWREIKFTSESNYLPFIIAYCVLVAYLLAAMVANTYTVVSVMTYFSVLVGGAIGYYQLPPSERERF